MKTRAIKLSTFLIIVLISCTKINAQENYWQQEVNYHIQVQLNDTNHSLSAKLDLEYVNHSQDTLEFIYFHLWPNGYKNNSTALAEQFNDRNKTDFLFAEEEQRGFIDSLDFNSDGEKLKWEFTEQIDIAKVFLNKALVPGATINISTPFSVKIPGDFSRLGHEGQSYQISQWYPKPAVYDKKGWHPMPYLDQGEFFSEFGSFEVDITLPKNYRVAATGLLQNKEEKEWINTIAEQALPTMGEDVDNDFPPSSKELKTLKFKQDKIHDFAWFADKRYKIVSSQVKLSNGELVDTYGYFLPLSTAIWKNSASYVDSAVYYYSKWVGDYPYSAATAVEGALSAGGGMEYPMVTVISAGNDTLMLDQVIAHEVGHNWFYGILASNERQHAWMDEGFNTYVESKYMKQRYPNSNLTAMVGENFFSRLFELNEYPLSSLNYYGSTILGSYGKQVPINTPSAEMNELNYGLNSYMHTGQLLIYLNEYLGDELMDKCMHAYYDRFKFKHVYPEDVKQVFEEVSNEDLSWFFDQLFNTNKQIDYKLVQSKNRLKLIQKESASIPTKIEKGENTIKIGENEKRVRKSINSSNNIFFNDDFTAPDINTSNDGKLPLDISFLTGLPDHRDYSLYWLPYIGLNTSDKFLLGLGLHNFEILAKPFEFYIAPAFSFGNKKLSGSYLMKYDWLIPEHKISKVRLYAKYNSFSIYDKINPGISFHLLNNKPYKLSRWFSLDYNLSFINDPLNPLYVDNQFVKAEYFYHKVKALSKTSIRTALSTGNLVDDPSNNFANIDMNIDQTFILSKKNIINIGLFGGTYIKKPSQASFFYTSTGMFDYGMNTYLVDRAFNEGYNGLGKYQILHDYGHFVGVNELVNNYMLSLKLEYQRVGIPIQPYLVAGIIDDNFYYDAGLSYRLNILTIYFPLVNNGTFNGGPDSYDQWRESIRFSLNLGQGNLFNQIEKLLD